MRGAEIDQKCLAASARDWGTSKTSTTNRLPLAPDHPRSNRPHLTCLHPTSKSQRLGPLTAEPFPGPRPPGGNGILTESESGISTGNATASVNTTRQNQKNRAGDRSGRRNRLILTSLPAAPNEQGFPSRHLPPTTTSLKSGAVSAPSQACPRHASRTKSARRPLEKDSWPSPLLAVNLAAGAAAADLPLPRRRCLPRDLFLASRRRVSNRSEIEGDPERRLLPSAEEFGPIAEEPRVPEPPRRRGGRAAIRSRGGDRGGHTGRPRESSPPLPPGAERVAPGAADREFESYRFSNLEPPVAPERGRAAEPTEFSRERTRPHNRAGEPGYVPRRERLRSVEQTPGDEPPPPAYGWSARHADLEADIESREFLAADEETLGRPGPAASPAEVREGKRRRRRRGRRRERERPEPETAAPAGEEFPSDLDDLDPASGYGPSFPRRPPEERLAGGEVDELDLDIDEMEDDDDTEDMGIEDQDLIVDDLRPEPPRAVEEEIDPDSSRRSARKSRRSRSWRGKWACAVRSRPGQAVATISRGEAGRDGDVAWSNRPSRRSSAAATRC